MNGAVRGHAVRMILYLILVILRYLVIILQMFLIITTYRMFISITLVDVGQIQQRRDIKQVCKLLIVF